jgi:Flp pilus assembly protein TadG
MKSRKQSSRKGQALLEFTLAAVPMIFLMISVEEMSRGMWIYTTLAHAVKEGTRYSVVHGADCAQANSSCPVTLGQVASRIKHAGVGLDASRFNVVLQTAGGSQSCAPLSSCLSNGTTWPSSPDNSIGLPLTVSGTYPFNTALSMFVPGAGSIHFGSLNFTAASQEEIRY